MILVYTKVKFWQQKASSSNATVACRRQRGAQIDRVLEKQNINNKPRLLHLYRFCEFLQQGPPSRPGLPGADGVPRPPGTVLSLPVSAHSSSVYQPPASNNRQYWWLYECEAFLMPSLCHLCSSGLVGTLRRIQWCLPRTPRPRPSCPSVDAEVHTAQCRKCCEEWRLVWRSWVFWGRGGRDM